MSGLKKFDLLSTSGVVKVQQCPHFPRSEEQKPEYPISPWRLDTRSYARNLRKFWAPSGSFLRITHKIRTPTTSHNAKEHQHFIPLTVNSNSNRSVPTVCVKGRVYSYPIAHIQIFSNEVLNGYGIRLGFLEKCERRRQLLSRLQTLATVIAGDESGYRMINRKGIIETNKQTYSAIWVRGGGDGGGRCSPCWASTFRCTTYGGIEYFAFQAEAYPALG